MEIGLFNGRDSMIAITRADSDLVPDKQTIEEKIINLNLEKRKSLLKVEARRGMIGDDVADKMKEKIEETYQR